MEASPLNKAIFLDRDGTINIDEGYTYRIEDLEFVPQAMIGLSFLQRLNYNIIIVTNQAGIAKGKYTKEDYFTFREEMHKRLKEKNVLIDAEYFCPHLPEENCNCRKPKTGMLEQAAKDFNLNLKKCWMIGDTPSDILTGKNAGCRTIQVLTGKCRTLSEYADFIEEDLLGATCEIYKSQ